MSWLSKLFGGSDEAGAAEPVVEAIEYDGYRIIPEPMAADGQFRLAGWIEKEIDGETRKHHLIRADLLRDRDEACQAAVRKAKQMIDQMGERLFD